MSKLIPFSLTVEDKAGKNNIVADALSRWDADQKILFAIFMPHLDLFDEIRKEQQQSEEVQQLISP